MARASKPRLTRTLSIPEARQQAEQLVTGDPGSCWVASARNLVAGMLLTADAQGELFPVQTKTETD